MSTKVLVVDDDPDARFLVRSIFRTVPGLVVAAEAEDGAAALAATESQPDVVLLDLGLPDIDGASLIPQLRERTAAKIIVFTAQDADVQHFAGLADGFVRKTGDFLPLLLLLDNLSYGEGQSASIALPMEPTAARAGRRFVEHHCRAWGCDDLIEAATLIASELITNAVLHAASHPHLFLNLTGETFRVEVIDDTTDPAVASTPGDFEEHGRGLLIVESVSRTWGSEPTLYGKKVWAELPCRPTAVS